MHACSGTIIPSVTNNPYAIHSSPTVVGGRVYVGHFDKNVYCLNANNGSLIWKYTTLGAVHSSPTVFAGRVYIGSNDGFLHAIRETDGKMLWRFDVSQWIVLGSDTVQGSACIIEDLNLLVFYTEANGVYRALDLNNGTIIKWSHYTHHMRPGVVYSNEINIARNPSTPVYVKEKGSLYWNEESLAMRIDVKTGEPLWPYWGGDPKYDGTPEGGIWNIPEPSQVPPAPSPYTGKATGIPSGEVFGPGYGPDRTGPNMLGFFCMASPAYADGKVYFGSHRKAFFCFDANSLDGKRLSWYQADGSVDSSPAIAYGNVYVGNWDWNLYCFTEGPPRRLDPNDPTRTVALLDSTSITGMLSATQVKVDEWIYIEGKISYITGAKIWERALVFADLAGPDGTKWKANMMAEWDGTYKIAFRPDIEGTWTVKPRWLGDTYNAGSEGTTLTFTVVASSSPSPTTQTTSSLTIITILATPAIVAMPIAAVLHKRKKK